MGEITIIHALLIMVIVGYQGDASPIIGSNQTSTTNGYCGQRLIPQPRIVSGVSSSAGEWPWQVAIYYKNNFHCGGMLIDTENILTAAHCVFYVNPKSLKIVFGNIIVNHGGAFTQTKGVYEIDIKTYIVHTDYQKPNRFSNDIALIHLERPAKITKYVRPICLPQSGVNPAPGTSCFVTGWGAMGFMKSMAKTLQKTSINITTQQECRKQNQKISQIMDTMFCAANRHPRLTSQSACHGDSGGPLACQRSDGSWEATGVVSWGSAKCNTTDAYTVFTKVSRYTQWIEKNTKKLNKKIIT